MKIWQTDFYRRPLKNEKGQTMWELIICDPTHSFIYEAKCPQSQANTDWLVSQLQLAAGGNLPDLIQVFRPQSLSLVTSAGEKLGIKVEGTRRTAALKEELITRASKYTNEDPVKLEKPPPQALPEDLWGEQWRFGTLKAGDVIEFVSDRPIPIRDTPESLYPINLGIASSVAVPGVVIYGGRRSMQLSRWLQEAKPVSLNYIPTDASKSGGLILEAGLVDRWVFITFEDTEFANAAQKYEDRKTASKGLHFLLVQPDDSEMTHTGFWLLKDE
ncbi:MAG: Tab2/Atab2 family RNA-binding protein [Prochloraceae cyanobacterium]|nr:Tab2/Atab2 family RNA-binding protein [Prochloraceae cyanobacterium]